MIKEITQKEFEERFPKISTYGAQPFDAFLENGVWIPKSDPSTIWNGETYTFKENGKLVSYEPIQEPISFNENGEPEDFEIVGYEKTSY